MVKVIYSKKLQKNKIALAVLAISSMISSYVSSASSSTPREQVSKQGVPGTFTRLYRHFRGTGIGAASSSTDPGVQPIVVSHQHEINVINVRMVPAISGNEFSLALPENATIYDLYRAVERARAVARAPETQVSADIVILTSGSKRIPNYLYPTNATRLKDLDITNDTTLQYVVLTDNYYQLHPEDTHLDVKSVQTAIHEIVVPRRLTQLHNTQEPIIGYPSKIECSSDDGKNWGELEDEDPHIDTNVKFRYVENRDRRYVVATPVFMCNEGRTDYVEHLFLSKASREYYYINNGHHFYSHSPEYYYTNNGHHCHPMTEYLKIKRLSPPVTHSCECALELEDVLDFKNFGDLSSCLNKFGYSNLYCKFAKDYPGKLAPSHIYRVNHTNDSNDLWGILSAYYAREETDLRTLSVDHHQILRTLLQNIGITYDPEFHNLLLEGYDGSIGFINHYKLKPGEAQWLRVAFRNATDVNVKVPHSASGRIYVRNNVDGESVCFVTLNPLPFLLSAVPAMPQ
jgi:hypothetical protein